MLDNLFDGLLSRHNHVAVGGVLLELVIALLGGLVPVDEQIGTNIELTDTQVDDVTNVLVLNTGATMDDQGEAVHGIADLLELIEGDVGLGLVLTMVGADSDGKGVDAGLLDELDGLLGIGIAHVGIGDGDAILGTADGTELGLNGSPWA